MTWYKYYSKTQSYYIFSEIFVLIDTYMWVGMDVLNCDKMMEHISKCLKDTSLDSGIIASFLLPLNSMIFLLHSLGAQVGFQAETVELFRVGWKRISTISGKTNREEFNCSSNQLQYLSLQSEQYVTKLFSQGITINKQKSEQEAVV